jgi:hypothetical protein
MAGRLELDGVFYDLKDDGTAAVVKCSFSAPKSLTLPGIVKANGREFVVESISGFKYWSGVKIVIPQTVEFLGDSCFFYCKSLSEVIFESGSNLKRIEKSAFCRSGLKSVRIPAKVEFIGEWCFFGVRISE